MNTLDHIKGALFGVAIGDALGVPVEFKGRASLMENPVKDFEEYKSHNQPAGTFSDDSSLTFCLAESLCQGYHLKDIGNRFVKWLYEGYWTAGGEVFDVGNTTRYAIARLKNGVQPELAGDFEEGGNGNGSLMRILPLLFYIKDMDIEKRYLYIREVSSLTHAHIRSVMACFYYLEFALNLLNGSTKKDAYTATGKTVLSLMQNKLVAQNEIDLFAPILIDDISKLPVEIVPSSGYVMSTLKATLWCFLNTGDYKTAVLAAVNLGNDTDTTAAVTGGLAGLYYGYETIPEKWRNEIKRKEDIHDLCVRLSKAIVHYP